MERFSRRLVKVLPEHNEQCQELLKLMGIPFIVVRCTPAVGKGECTTGRDTL